MQDVYSFFTMGSLLALLEIEKLKKKTLTTIFLVSLGALVVATCLGFFRYTHYFLLPIVCISFGISSWRYINSIGSKIGDLSYGIYLFGFPVQQLIEYFLKPTPLEMMLYALPVVIILAYLSWSFVEKKALMVFKLRYLISAYLKQYSPSCTKGNHTSIDGIKGL